MKITTHFHSCKSSRHRRCAVLEHWQPQKLDAVIFQCDSHLTLPNSEAKSETPLLLRRKFMSINDRRIVPRKPYAMPMKFVVLSQESAGAGNFDMRSGPLAAQSGIEDAPLPYEGETVNLSERGVGFKSQQPLSLGQTIEVFFTLPTELTGRIAEDVRCIAKVVHVDPDREIPGYIRVGAMIERF